MNTRAILDATARLAQVAQQFANIANGSVLSYGMDCHKNKTNIIKQNNTKKQAGIPCKSQFIKKS